ncbi:hypothetical protein MMC13_005195 [Lambiella insularis]|nr:hypothetical protein [Lambiella insularis]
MPVFSTNDDVKIFYQDVGPKDALPLIMIHGFTGSSAVFLHNIHPLSQKHRVIAPDLRGHGESESRATGYHVSRLAMDLKNLIDHLELPHTGDIIAIGASLGAAVLWSYSELFTTAVFSHMVFVDQAPLQNYTADGDWGPSHGSRGCNSAATLAYLQATLNLSPGSAYQGIIDACLAYRSHPLPTDNVSAEKREGDSNFFLEVAMLGDASWRGKLMANHTALDWRASIRHNFATRSSTTKVLVIASERSGCFPTAGPLTVVDLINAGQEAPRRLATGVTISWGGHWCYWENPEKFNALVREFLNH